MHSKDNKIDRLSFRITEEHGRMIDNLIEQGIYLNRSEFGMKAIQLLLEKQGEIKSWRKNISEILWNLMIAVEHPAHTIPDDIKESIKFMVSEERLHE